MKDESNLTRYVCLAGEEIASAIISVKEIEACGDPLLFYLPAQISSPIIAAARYTDRFQSDLLISLNSVIKSILGGEYEGHEIFGFRRDGVDHNSFYDSNMINYYKTQNYGMMEQYYRKAYAIEWHVINDGGYDDGDIKMSLIDVLHAHPMEYPEEKDIEEAKNRRDKRLAEEKAEQEGAGCQWKNTWP